MRTFFLAAALLVSSFSNASTVKDVYPSVVQTTENEYMLIFRMAPMKNYKPSEAEIKAMEESWGAWIGNLATNGKLVKTNEVGEESVYITSNQKTTNKPFMQDNLLVGGYLIVKANTLAEATEIAKSCPILKMGGTVEVRNLIAHS